VPSGTFSAATPDVTYVAILPAPPDGSDWSYTIPARTRAQLQTGRATLHVRVGLAIRYVQLYIRGPAGIIARSSNFVAHAPPNVVSYTLVPASGSLPTFVPLDAILDFPPGLLLLPGDVVGVQTAPKRFTDFWDNITLQFLQQVQA
jgi:hypothetical protein